MVSATHPTSSGLRAGIAIALALAVAAVLLPAGDVGAQPPPHADNIPLELRIEVLSSEADMVSGGDALIGVEVPRNVPLHQVQVTRDGVDVTDAFTADDDLRTLVGVVEGFEIGESTLRAEARGRGHGRPSTELTVTNHPITGPIFSGPNQYPFLCTVEAQGLGQPLVDNQDGDGVPVYEEDGDGAPIVDEDHIVGWSRDCSADPRYDYLYYDTDGNRHVLRAHGEDPPAERPADLATTTLTDGRDVDHIIRWERGTTNRFIHAIAMLAPWEEVAHGSPLEPRHDNWNGRLVYSFDGGVGIGHSQGSVSTQQALLELRGNGSSGDVDALSRGYAVAFSTGNRTSTHYNLVVGGETALMVKERFIVRHGVPDYTVGIGTSGGGIQQYVYGQNHPGLIDAAVPVRAYPDMATQTIHIGDCELLEFFMDVTDGANTRWHDYDDRQLIQGLNTIDGFTSSTQAFKDVILPQGATGSTECAEGWLGLLPLAMNPLFGTAPGLGRLAPAVVAAIEWTHWDDARSVYGTDPETGFARSTWDNVGVQYGLQALVDGDITSEEFLHLNATVGGWVGTHEMVQEGCPFISALCGDPDEIDPWSSRNSLAGRHDGPPPVPRTEGDVEAIRAAYEEGLVFTGEIDIPVIDLRQYLEAELDMHNSIQSFAARERIQDAMGDDGHHVIWFVGEDRGGENQYWHAFQVLDEWIGNIRANPDAGVAANRPAAAVDTCFADDGTVIASGDGVWAGILDDGPAGECTETYPPLSTSRIVAGGPVSGDVYKCALKPVSEAVADGTYGSWEPDADELAQLEAIFPDGVCDYSQPDVGRP